MFGPNLGFSTKKGFKIRDPKISWCPYGTQNHEIRGPPVCLIFKVLAWEICNMKWGFSKKVMIKSQKQFMYGSNFCGSDVTYKTCA